MRKLCGFGFGYGVLDFAALGSLGLGLGMGLEREDEREGGTSREGLKRRFTPRFPITLPPRYHA